MTNKRIILASGSAIRAQLLRGAGIDFQIIKPNVDEDVIKKEAAARGVSLDDTAMQLAESKALAVARDEEGFVIGADQILKFDNRAYDKPKSIEEARTRFLEMQGAPHTLINAVTVARRGEIIWRSLERPMLFMRALSPEEIDIYLEEAGPEILASVGAYQIENTGSRLFDRIEGDHFAVLGLALYPLLAFLRKEGAIAY